MARKSSHLPDAPLRVLILEDSPADAEMVERRLRSDGLDFTSRVVSGKRGFAAGLKEFAPQVILSDFKLPGFDGMAALEMARARLPKVPFIFVSGSIGEEKAIETLAHGAADYIFKDNLARLTPAVRRELAEASLRREKEKNEEDLRRLAEAAEHFVHLNDLDHLYRYLAAIIREISGADYLLLSLYDETQQGLRPKILEGVTSFQDFLRRRLGRASDEMILLLKDMTPGEFSDFVSRKLLPVRNGLYTLTDRSVPRSACRQIEKAMGIAALYAMGFSWENQLFGGLALAYKKGKELRNGPMIEAVTNLAAVAIKRLLAEQALSENEEKFRMIADNTADTITVLDMNLKFTYVSPAIFKLRGYTVEETLQQTLEQIMTPESLDRVRTVLAEEMAQEASGGADPLRSRTLELQEYHKNGSLIWIENTISFLRDPRGKASGFLAISKDISERKHADEQIRYQADLLQKVSDAIIATDQSGRIQMWNSAAEAIYGWKAQEAEGRIFHDMIQPEYRFQRRDEVIGKMEREGTWSGELIHHLHDGRQIPVLSTITMLKDAAGNPAGTVSVNHDISKRMQAEEQIRSSLKEKEVLLQEIHHRVKNNLQIVSGLLTLQSDQGGGHSMEEIFRQSQGRIRSIALVHEKLYKSHNLAEIAFDDYLRSLVDDLIASHYPTTSRIATQYKLERILFSIETAIPLGLIVNELVTNALKHAFPGKGHGVIRVELNGQEKDRHIGIKTESGTLFRVPSCELIVADDGRGLPPGGAPGRWPTLGMSLVAMLVEQLHGQLTVLAGPGAQFRILFPVPPRKEGPAASRGSKEESQWTKPGS
jgi:PAS domain S-box-containing protein